VWNNSQIQVQTDVSSKFEHSKTFGLISSSTANAIWTPSAASSNSTARQTGAGQAYVGANEEVLCWDLKKGDLLSRWRAHDCKAEVAVIAKSKADQDIFAVGYGPNGSNFGGRRLTG
jgi:U3 small nucleolar RNA-associated protein 12